MLNHLNDFHMVDQAFSASYDLAPPSPSSRIVLSLFLRLPVRLLLSLLTEVVEEQDLQNHTTAREPGPFCIIQFLDLLNSHNPTSSHYFFIPITKQGRHIMSSST
jgi:hypothetical protein